MLASTIDSKIFRDIFSQDDMRKIFSDQGRVQFYLDVEAALAKTQARMGMIPQQACDEIVRNCKSELFDFDKLKSTTELVGFPVLPVVEQLVSLCKGDLGQYCHWGTTTQDITDTALILQIRAALALIKNNLDTLVKTLSKLAAEYKDTPMIGRSNMQQATPITFGYKVATWLNGILRHQERLSQLQERVLFGEFGGAAGTLASLGDKGLEVRAGLMQELKLQEASITWHTVHDTIAEVGCFLGLITASVAKIAMDVKLMMSTEVAEVAEPFIEGRGASSTMPQKRNPVSCNIIHACSAQVKMQTAALLEAMVADHERATGPWEIEWVAIPDIFCLTAGALYQANFMLAGLDVYPDNMLRNLKLTNGLVCAEAVMMALANKLGRAKAHDLLYDQCRIACNKNENLFDVLTKVPEIMEVLSTDELKNLLDPTKYTGSASAMVDKVLMNCR